MKKKHISKGRILVLIKWVEERMEKIASKSLIRLGTFTGRSIISCPGRFKYLEGVTGYKISPAETLMILFSKTIPMNVC